MNGIRAAYSQSMWILWWILKVRAVYKLGAQNDAKMVLAIGEQLKLGAA